MGSRLGSVIETPFGSPVDEVPLPSAPLALVVVQVRFERIASILEEQFIAPFQEAIRDAYPVMHAEQQAGIIVTPDGRVTPAPGSNIWRFDERPTSWQVSLAPDFVALSTPTYTSRQDLLARLAVVLTAAAQHLRVRFCSRLGVRYLDRVTDPALLEQLPALVKPEVLGAAVVELGDPEAVRQHQFVDATYALPGPAEMHARWGVLPGGTTFDPSVAPADGLSWVLDLDASMSERPFDAPALGAATEDLCQRVYRFFRWAVTDDFLRAHGGRP